MRASVPFDRIGANVSFPRHPTGLSRSVAVDREVGIGDWLRGRSTIVRGGREVIASTWIGWEIGAVTAGNDRFDTVADAVGLSLVLSGGVEVTWSARGRRRSVAFAAGMSDLRPADGDHHTYLNRWRPGSQAFCLVIPPEQLRRATLDEEISGSSEVCRHLFGFHDPVVARCLRRLAAAGQESIETLDIEWMGRTLLCHILALQGAGLPGWQDCTTKLPAGVVRRVGEYVDAHLSGGITLANLAAVSGLSPGHFARSFRATAGVTPGHYVRARRVAFAFHRVVSSDLPLDDIARMSGFCSQSHMTRSFAPVTGVTPGYARRRRLRPHDLSHPMPGWR